MRFRIHLFPTLLSFVLASQLAFGQAVARPATGSSGADRPAQPGLFQIVADADCSIANSHPDQIVGPHLRADEGGSNKIYLRFFVGWTARQHIRSAKLVMTTSDWYYDPGKSFEVYSLRDGIPADSRLGWDESTLTANNAPANLKNANGFDPELTWKLGVMNGGNAPDNDSTKNTGQATLIFASPELVRAIAGDTNGYLTLLIAARSGAGNSCFASRFNLGQAPLLDITTDGKGGVDETQPMFIATSGARQTMSGYGVGMGSGGGIKIPGDYWNQTGQGLGTMSDTPDRLAKYFKYLYTDTGANTTRVWAGDLTLKDWDKGFYQTGVMPAALHAGLKRVILCSNPPPSMWAPAPTPDSYGIQPLSEAGVTDYPEYLAEFTARVKAKYGLTFYMVTIANEELRIRIADWPRVVKNLRQALDERGLTDVKIGAVDWPSVDGYFDARVRAIKADPEAWKDLDAVTFHSYGLSMTEPHYLEFIQGQPGKEMWETESEASGATETSCAKDLAGHMINDIDHGSATWLYHESGLQALGDHMSQILGFDPNGSESDWLSDVPKYYYFKAIATTCPVGTRMRRIWGTTVGDAWYPGWGTPKAMAMAGQCADGSWGAVLLNTAEDNASDAQRTYSLAVEDLATVPRVEGTLTRIQETTSNIVKPTAGPKYVPLKTTTEPIDFVYGVSAPITLGPNEIASIKTSPVARGN